MTENAQPTTGVRPQIIVGIGASAGGLEAFTRLLHGLAPDSGLAYVLVQHLAPDHESLLPELLARTTTIPVTQAVDGVRVDAGHAYVIPPNANMTLTDGHLRVGRRTNRNGTHFSVDTFLCSLADVHGPNAMAVILSGAGSDGARGVEAIKEVGGIVFAQNSASAQHPNMPEAAVATGCVDFVLSPEQIAERLSEIGRYAERQAKTPTTGSENADEVGAILRLLHRHTGVDFARYRRGTVERRLLRRMLMHRRETRSDYLKLLRGDSAEVDALYQDMLIGVTSFFRDPAMFTELQTVGLPTLLKSRHTDMPFRAWVAGCSTGEEAYSLAIAIVECMSEAHAELPIQIFATDLSESAIARARTGRYPESIGDHVSPDRLQRFFVREDGKYRIAKSIRDLCIFSRQNIVRDPPFSRLDLVSCRNVLIYMEPALQNRVFPIFHYALEPNGLLVLGIAESPGGASDLFEPVSKRNKLYRRRPGASRALDVGLGAPAPAERPRTIANAQPTATIESVQPVSSDLAAQIDRVVLARHGTSGVVVNDKFEIIHFRGDTTPFLAHGPGAPTLDVRQLIRAELATRLRAALHRAANDRAPAREENIPILDGEKSRHVSIDVAPLPGPNEVGFAVLFTEEARSPAAKRAGRRKAGHNANSATEYLQAVEAELSAAKAYTTELVEAHRATIEELRAAGEEIQSSNEELQSTNEELETTKEEVQSTNEELTTLNEELRHRNRELGEMASDLANVFASALIPIVIVGRDLKLRRFTPATTRVMKVIPSDGGRPLSDVKLRFAMPDLDDVITETANTLAVSERVVRADDGVWWSLTIRPYQTVDRRVDGAVLVFSDVDTSKRSEEHAAETSELHRLALVTAEETRLDVLARTNDLLASNLADRERSETERNALLRELATAQEDERRRLSRELHDEAGQHLTALGLGLQGLVDVAPPGSEIDRRAEALRELVDVLGQELHGIALRLRPKALDDFGLEAAVSGYAQDWSRASGIAIDIHADGEIGRLPSIVESAVYRIVQEALTNVAKHSGAARASVVIERRNGALHAIVEDDGSGLDETRTRDGRSGSGLGLLGIHERAALLGGSVEIESVSNGGTTLFVRIPIGDTAAAIKDSSRGNVNDE